MPALASLLCGFIFGLGLVISQMVSPTKVLAFLDFFGIPTGTWDPSLKCAGRRRPPSTGR